MSTLNEITGFKKLSDYDGLLGRHPMHCPDRFFGVEVEMEGVTNKSFFPGSFKFHKDGSLKVSGAEYVTVPIQCRFLEVELKRLFDAHTDAYFSSRCSIHYHMNVRDMTWVQIKNMIVVYLMCERMLYKISGDRWKNIFCIPISQLTKMVRGSLNCLYFPSPIEWSKYTGFNILPMSTLGTVEFRMSTGTKDINSILRFINILSCIKTAGMKVPKEEILETLKTHTVDRFLSNVVFGSYWDSDFWSEQDILYGDMAATMATANLGGY